MEASQHLSLDSLNEDGGFPEFTQPIHLKSLRSSNYLIWGTKYNNPSLAGYNPRNGDFEIEHENNAEQIISLASELYDYSVRDRKETSEEEEKLMNELQVTLFEIYNSKLKERAIRKQVIKEHGLLNLKGSKLWYSQLEVKELFILRQCIRYIKIKLNSIRTSCYRFCVMLKSQKLLNQFLFLK